MLIGGDKKLINIVLKNMSGHLHRNSKTAIMFTIALSFLIFTGSSFELIGHMLISQLRQLAGADFNVNGTLETEVYLDEVKIRGYLEDNKKLIASYSFQSATLDAVVSNFNK